MVQVNASSIGVGAALMQHNHVISFHSRALTPQHFHHYLFGHSFDMHTDHQPLVQLTRKPLYEISPRLQCLLLKVTQYSFTTVYVKHNGIPVADCLSRNIAMDTAKEDESLNMTIVMISLFQEGKLNEIKCKMAKDILLVKLACVIQNGWPAQCAELNEDDLNVFWIHRLNLSVVNGIIMNGTRIVILKSLQAKYLRCLHTGHFGISKCQARAKSTVYWPGIDRDITSCDSCKEAQHAPPTFDEHSVEACYPGHIYGRHWEHPRQTSCHSC